MSDGHEKLATAAVLEETERLQAMQSDIDRTLLEVRPNLVRILMPEQTYKDSYSRIAPRVALETLMQLACVRAGIPVEMLHRNTARSRLNLSRKGKLEDLMASVTEPVGKYWNAGRSLAAAAALAEEK
ncbi:MAG TPA: hypothetical protein VFY36_00935 [Solirubrobacteraceae bacterium]|nr:hypothetical protein [Solirubrobacteraceae bacterium]